MCDERKRATEDGTLVVFAVKSMNTTSGNLKNKRRSECRTHAMATTKGRRWGKRDGGRGEKSKNKRHSCDVTGKNKNVCM